MSDKVLFFDGENPGPAEFNQMETLRTFEDTVRFAEIGINPGGVLYGLDVTDGGGFVLDVSAGVAYDELGRALRLSAPTTVPFAISDVGKYVIVRYSFVENTPQAHPVTGVLNNTRVVSSPQFAVVTTPLSTDVILSQITFILAGIATLDTSARMYWGTILAPGSVTDAMLDPTGDVITHINTFGTGTVTATNPHGLAPADIGFVTDITPTRHQILDHVDGFENYAGTPGLVTVDSATAPDRLLIQDTIAGDSVMVNGIRLEGASLFDPLVLTFGVEAGANPELWVVTVDSTGVITKTKAAAYTAAKNALGVQLVDISPHGVVLPNATYPLQLAVSSGGTVFKLSFNNGPEQTLDAVDKFYELVEGSGTSDRRVKVWVDFSALPGSDGTYVDNVQVLSGYGRSLSNQLVLATAPWSGSATGFLGYGDHGASGVAYDKRPSGNLDQDNLSDELKELIDRVLSETRSAGWASGATATSSLLQLTVLAGVCYRAGRRRAIPKTVLAVPINSTSYIYVDETDTLVQSTTDPDVQHANYKRAIVRAYRVISDATQITSIQDQRTMLPLIDATLARAGLIDQINVWTQPQQFDTTTEFNSHADFTQSLQTAESDIRHANKIVVLPASMGEPETTIGTGGLSSPTNYWTSVAAFNIQYPLPLAVGDRIKAVSAYILDTASTVTLQLYRVTLSTGAATQVGGTQTSAGTSANQTLTISSLTETVADGTAYYLLVTCPGNARSYGAKYTYDRVA